MSENWLSDAWCDEFRRQMPVTGNWAYMDHAAVAPMSSPARGAVLAWCREACEAGDTSWAEWAARVERVRTVCAAMLNASEAEIAFVHNTTTGISLVAEGLDWATGDNVVTLGNEFPSNLYPWMNLADRGVHARRVPVERGVVDIDRIFDHCDARTRLISLSWVGYASGWRVNVAEVVARAHERGILVFLDAIQALGVFPLDVRRVPVDFLAADGHKWMLGPEGAGILYIRREHLPRLRTIGVGWNSVEHAHDFGRIELTLRPSAVRYEGGSQNMVGVLALGASLELLASLGLSFAASRVADRVLAVTDFACERLAEAGADVTSNRTGDGRSGIVMFRVPGHDPERVRAHCLARRVVLSCRGGQLRISPHGYASGEDIQQLVEAIRSVRG